MISFLKGNFIFKNPSLLVVDLGGIGYEVHISLNSYKELKDLTNGKIEIYHHITEQSQLLFGFVSAEEKEIFLLLISVNGVGVHTARLMISGLTPHEIRQAIAAANFSVLEKVKGIGRKTAERMVVELKDKLGKFKIENSSNNVLGQGQNQVDAIQALMALGISRSVAEKGIEKALLLTDDKNNLEALIKLALKNC